MEFSWPWIFLLLPLPLLFRQPTQSLATNALRIPPMLSRALDDLQVSSRYTMSVEQIAMWLAWIALLVALAQPWRPGDTVVQPVSGRALAMVVDLSGSMERRDFTLDGETSDRLSVVKSAAGQFIEARQGDRISLILFGREAFVASPLSFDLDAIRTILDSAGIGMAGRSTAIGDALGLAIKTLRDDNSNSKAIVLLSDGTNNSGSAEPESAASFARDLGIRIHSVAMGSDDSEASPSGYATANSADLDEATLQAIANDSGGKFFRARSSAELSAVYKEIDKLERSESDAPPVVLQQDLRHWPLLFMLGLLTILAIRRRLD